MTVERLGLAVSSREDVERVNGILQSFTGGFNAMITRPTRSGWEGYCDSLPVLYCPFAHEGAAMGHTLRNLFLCTPRAFEKQIVKRRPGMRYLYYVGFGFWSGMRNHDAGHVARLIGDLDPMYRYLCYDGYGFKHAFFDYPKNPDGLRPLEGLEGYARSAAFHGVGRAFWFLYLDRIDMLTEQIEKLGENAVDAAAGLGLASVFVNPDRLKAAQTLGGRLPPQWRDGFHLGMCFGAKARSINDPDAFEEYMSRADGGTRDAVWASIRECDRVELQVRAERGEDGYRRWRGQVTEWMASHIEFPLAGVKATESNERGRGTADELRDRVSATGGTER